MRVSSKIITLISFAAAVSALPTTNVNKMPAARDVAAEDAEDEAAIYPVKWIKRNEDAEDEAAIYPVKWIKRNEDSEDEAAIYPVKWIKRNEDSEDEAAIYPVKWIKE